MNQLTRLYNTFTEALYYGKVDETVFSDISKAFDSVWNAGLLHVTKLKLMVS